jgi:hypothetical protein
MRLIAQEFDYLPKRNAKTDLATERQRSIHTVCRIYG